MPASIYKPLTFKPLTGPFDARSNIDEVPPGAFRWKQNFCIDTNGKLARAKGWKRAFNYPCVTNHDWHNQHVASNDDREPMTLMFPSTAANGVRRLFGGTKTRIVVLDEVTGDWTTLGVAFGDDGSDNLTQLRFNAAELKDKVFFTNNFDEVQYHALGSGTVQPIDDLAIAAEGGGAVTRAKRVISWNSLTILLNTEEEGTRFPSRVRWSDLNDGLAWKPGVGNTVGDFQDLDYGHVILNAVPIGTSLFIFCDRSIWRCNFVVDATDGTLSLNAVRVHYDERNKSKCLAYPNSLISDGRSAYYLGSDGYYVYTPGYTPEPELTDWLHRSSSIIFGGEMAIDQRSCESPFAELKPSLNEIHLSWPIYDIEAEIVVNPNCEAFTPTSPLAGTGFNRKTLVVNTKYKTCDFRDYGFTAACNFTTDFAGVGQCNTESAFLIANTDDLTLKQLEIGQAREMYVLGADSYTMAGYFTILRGIFPFERFDSEKEVAAFLAGVTPEDPDDTAVLRLRLGTSEIALDPNTVNGRCAVLFRQLSDQGIKCRYTKSAAQYTADNQKPNDPVQWNYFLRGRFLFYELTIAAADRTAPKTGGLTLSRLEVSARII